MSIWGPKVVMRNRAIVDLDCRLVIFGDKYRGVITHGLADPNIIIIVGVFHDLSSLPVLLDRIPFLLRDGGQAIAVIPRVEFAFRAGGVGFGGSIAFGIVGVSVGAIGG